MIPSQNQKKLRPFVPLATRRRSLSPPPDIDIGVNSTPLPGSSGMFLLICNIFPPGSCGFGKPVELVEKAISEVTSSDDGMELSDILVTVIAGGHPQDPHSSSAYLELAQEIKSLDTVPRPDLLADWKNALAKCRPSWDIVWAPQRKGKDRRMVVRFRVAESKEKVPANATDKIRTHLESKGHKTTGGYISFNGLVDVNLADTESVDAILATSYYTVTSLSKEAMHVSPPRYIPVNNPFELGIGGLNEYEGLHETIDKWLYHTYVYNDADRTPRVFDTCMSSDREFFIFTMDSWESTLAVLKDAEAFRAYFANSPLLAEPKLLFELNSGGFGHKSITMTIDSGAGLLNDAITDLKREVADLRKDHRESDTLVQRQFDNVNKNMENQGNSISIIGNQLHQYGLYLLASRDEKAIEGKIHGIESSLAFEVQCMRSADDIGEKAVFKANILSLQNQHRELSLLLGKASEVTLKLMGPAPGSVVPQLQIAAAALPTQPPAPTTVDQPIPAPATPARTPRASAAKPAQVVITPAGPVTPSHSTCS